MKRMAKLLFVMVLACSLVLPPAFNAYADGDINEDDGMWVSISEAYDDENLYFTPSYSATYNFVSSDNDEDCDPKAELYNDDSGEYLTENDDQDDDNKNFLISYYLEEGVTYRIRCYCYGEGTGSFYVSVYSEGGSYEGDDEDEDYYRELTEEDSLYIDIDEPETYERIKFVPTYSGTYVFSSFDNEGDPYETLYDSDDNKLDENDDEDGSEDGNFAIIADLTRREILP